MTEPALDAHVCLDTHPTHPSAVIAIVTGSQAHIAVTALEADGWETAADNTLQSGWQPVCAALTAVQDGRTAVRPRYDDAWLPIDDQRIARSGRVGGYRASCA
ncbi:hypothetical protein ABZ760_25235 [Streptomyces sp. NPDC006658]|uniref:hypothetical protein n=1 Tax=Streptomyces sp. NPDC006658 TaxID=3156900 RepID=UPI0033FCE5C9